MRVITSVLMRNLWEPPFVADEGVWHEESSCPSFPFIVSLVALHCQLLKPFTKEHDNNHHRVEIPEIEGSWVFEGQGSVFIEYSHGDSENASQYHFSPNYYY